MAWLDSLERLFPRLAFPGLLRTVSFFMLLTFGLDYLHIQSMGFWALNGNKILDGQVWRMVTFLFVPLSQNPFFIFFELMILVMIGDALESSWGSFKLTVYYLIGAIATLIVAFLAPYSWFGSQYLNLTLFLAFATVFPDYELLLFFIIPVKVKYLAMFSGAFIVWDIVVQPLPIKIVALTSIGNYLLFFGPAAFSSMKRGAKAYERRKKYDQQVSSGSGPRHVCAICGDSDISNPGKQFRYCTCSECGSDGVAFCLDHLSIHKGAKETLH